MNKYVFILILLAHFCFGQKTKTIITKFQIPLSESANINSIYFYKNIEEKLIKLDTTVTSEQVISLTKYKISEKIIKPKYLDSLFNVIYKLNEEKKYIQAIEIGKIILKQSPNNISGMKELSFAYRKSGNENLANSYFSMLVKIVYSVFKYGDGTFEFPYLLNNFSEGISIYESAFRCKPKKTAIILDKRKRLLGAYNGYSSALDEIIIKYSELSHWKSELKANEYSIQK